MSDAEPVTPVIFVIANQKGGVGKTTTAINFAAGLAIAGQKTLLLDIDPQGNASTGLGLSQEDRTRTTYDLIFSPSTAADCIHATGIPRLFLCPATSDLASADLDLAASENRSFMLRQSLRHPDFTALGFRFIVIDCPPSLNLLTINALVACDSVIVPLQTEFFALEGLSQLMLTIREVRQTANPALRIEGVLLTMQDSRNRLAQQVEEDARQTLGDLVFKTAIPRNVRVSEAPSFALPVITYDAASKGSEAYQAFVREVLQRHQPNTKDEDHGKT
jgi:chromosome partitioning protein